MEDGYVKYIEEKDRLILVPKERREKLLFQYHDGSIGGHLSSRKTTSKLRKKYFWPTMKADVKIG